MLIGILWAVSAWPATVSVGDGAVRPGGTVDIAVAGEAGVDLGGVNLRLEYDPTVFVSAGVSRGPLLSASHFLAYHIPSPGKLNVAAYAPLDAPSFASQTGTLFAVSLQVSPSAATGEYPISFSTTGAPLLASSGLSDMIGTSIAHAADPGSVTVFEALIADIDHDGDVTEADLIIMLQEWHQTSSAPFPKADINLDTTVNEKDLIIFQKDWKNPPPVGNP